MKLGVHAMGHGTAQKIHFIGICHSDQQICVLNTGVGQGIHGGTVAANAHDVVQFHILFQQPIIPVDQGHIMALCTEKPCQGGTHHAGTGDDNIHKITLLGKFKIGVIIAQQGVKINVLANCINIRHGIW